MHSEPLVSIVTPVYNGAPYLRECIESVLNQTYRNFEYLIVNNCSTDHTLKIANEYAKKDHRVRVHDNREFLDVIANHNHAFHLISPLAKYCKVVSGDDFLFTDCLDRMVALAEANPSLGIIGAYQLLEDRILWQGFYYPQTEFPGREICRQIFLGGREGFGFGSPTSLLYRADLVNSSQAFYPNSSPHSDTSACFRHLKNSSFGFVYQVLSYNRAHNATQSAKSQEFNRYASAYLNDLILYGPYYLDEKELQWCVSMQLKNYHRFLATSYFFASKERQFWEYHKSRLEELGFPLKKYALVKAAVIAIYEKLTSPSRTAAKLRSLLSRNLTAIADRTPRSTSGVVLPTKSPEQSSQVLPTPASLR